MNGRAVQAIVLGVVAALALTACGGSDISPEQARDMHREAAGLAQGDAIPGDTVNPGVTGGDGTVTGTTTDGGQPGGSTPSGSGGTGGTAGGDTGTSGSGPQTPGGGGKPATGTGKNAANGGVRAASCDGFKNQTGITDSEITLANVSDLSGPVPGLFAAARDGVQAYVAYFNATSSICGRKLKLVSYDSRTDAGGDQIGYSTACKEAFAAVGSTSILDSGGAAAADECGIPDLRAVSLSNERVRCSVCYPAQSSRTGFINEGPYVQMRKENKAVSENSAFLYLNTGGSPILAQGYAQVAKQVGWKVKMVQGIDTAEFNYGPYVQRMKSLGVKYVHFVSATPQAIRLVRAMHAANFKPEIYQLSQTQYTREYTDGAGSDANGSLIALPHGLFSEPSAEMKLYLTWLQQVRPGADPSTFGVFAWSAMRLFVENATELGGKLTRASLLKEVRAERRWTANGIHLLMDVGGKNTYSCNYLVRYAGGSWKASPKSQVCGKIRRTSFAE